MKKTLRRLSLVMIATALVFTGCKKDQEEENNGGNGGGTSTVKPEYVDLGLPSGTKWATFNVGATTPEEYGNYYAWGEITTKNEYSHENSVTYRESMTDISGNATYDVARANWGGSWRMPTRTEMEELKDNCTWTWTTQNGVNGMKVTGTNGNSIFLPAAGRYEDSRRDLDGECGIYWGSTPDQTSNFEAIMISFGKDIAFNADYFRVEWSFRYYGHPVRPVLK